MSSMNETTAQAAFLGRIRQALGHAPDIRRDPAALIPQGLAPERAAVAERSRSRSAAERRELARAIVEVAAKVRLMVQVVGSVEEAAAGIAAVAAEHEPEWSAARTFCAWDHPLVARLNLPALCAGIDAELILPGPQTPDYEAAVREAFIGVTAADRCVAESATMLLLSGPGRPRSTSLLPSIHVAVATLGAVVADFDELYALLHEQHHTTGLPNSFTFVSGPSKTADIEATMVHGAHGPRAAYLFIIDEA